MWWRRDRSAVEFGRRLKDLVEFSDRDRLGRFMVTKNIRPRRLRKAVVALLAVVTVTIGGLAAVFYWQPKALSSLPAAIVPSAIASKPLPEVIRLRTK